MADTSDYELIRQQRIANNIKRIQELEIPELRTSPPPAARRKQKAKQPLTPGESQEQRKSQRPRKEVCYKELEGVGREYGGSVAGVKRYYPAKVLEGEEAEQVRAAAQAALKNLPPTKSRGPSDSGKGVRIQGGKVYDSKFGVTCHWCRQKTLEDHVSCSSSGCGGGKRLPTSFCKNCLKNRHGEDAELAYLSGKWVCPICRGSCGAGCTICCNCGPCRKKAGLEPTHQIKSQAVSAGFDNVHDYLIHLVTGESAEVACTRKTKFSWGAWLLGEDHADDLAVPVADAPPPTPAHQEPAVPPKAGNRRKGRASAGAKSVAVETEAPAAQAQKPAMRAGKKGKANADVPTSMELDAPAAKPQEAPKRNSKAKGKAASAPDEVPMDVEVPVEPPQQPAGHAARAVAAARVLQDSPKPNIMAAQSKAAGDATTISSFFPASKAHAEVPAKLAEGAAEPKLNRRQRMMQKLGLKASQDPDGIMAE